MPRDPLRLYDCPLCGGHVQFAWGPDGAVHGLFCQGCKMYVRWNDPELALKPREQFDAQMMRWAKKWNRRTANGKSDNRA